MNIHFIPRKDFTNTLVGLFNECHKAKASISEINCVITEALEESDYCPSHGSRAFGHGSVAPGITSDLDPTTEEASSAVSGARQEALSEALRCIADTDSAVVAAEWMAWARAVARDALRADRDRERFAGETVEILMDDHTWREARVLERGSGAGDHGDGWLLVEEGGLQSWVEPGEWRSGQARGQ